MLTVEEGVSVSRLRSRYNSLIAEFAGVPRDAGRRWEILTDVALARIELRARGVEGAYGLSEPGAAAVSRRTRMLLLGVLRHLDVELPVNDLFVLADRLDALDTWQHARERVGIVAGGAAARQEDVLSQELAEIARGYRPELQPVLSRVRMLRARDTALATWDRLSPLLAPTALRRPRVVSLGVGLAQFEDLVARRLDTTVDCVDVPDSDCPPSAGRLSFQTLHPVNMYTMPERAADLLILKDVLHHVRRPQLLVPMAAGWVRAGGRVLVIEPRYAASDTASRRTLRELDSTATPDSLLSTQTWERLFTHARLTIDARLELQCGVLDNNDSFPRIAWVLRRVREDS